MTGQNAARTDLVGRAFDLNACAVSFGAIIGDGLEQANANTFGDSVRDSGGRRGSSD
jgi:hypothetical protein